MCDNKVLGIETIVLPLKLSIGENTIVSIPNTHYSLPITHYPLLTTPK